MNELRLKMLQMVTNENFGSKLNSALSQKLGYTNPDEVTYLGIDALQPMATEIEILQDH